MANEAEKNYLNWIKKAEEDELSIKAILKEGSPSTACFLSQQMAEKMLKGLLVYHQGDFPKIHDLLRLETLLLKYVPDIHQLHDEASLLNRYNTEARYPGDFQEYSQKEAEEAFAAATIIKEFVLKKFTKPRRYSSK